MNYKAVQEMRKSARLTFSDVAQYAPEIAAGMAGAGGVALAHQGLSGISWLQKRKRLLGALEVILGFGAGVGTGQLVRGYGDKSIENYVIGQLKEPNNNY